MIQTRSLWNTLIKNLCFKVLIQCYKPFTVKVDVGAYLSHLSKTGGFMIISPSYIYIFLRQLWLKVYIYEDRKKFIKYLQGKLIFQGVCPIVLSLLQSRLL
jgi:hypothetical protein